MFIDHPLGCGHRCTATLSPFYLDDFYLTGPPESRARSSHNTYLTMLVEHGVVGGLFVVSFLLWLMTTALKLNRQIPIEQSILPGVLPSTIAILSALLVADVFVDHLKMEIRMWYLALVIVNLKLARQFSGASALARSARSSPNSENVWSNRSRRTRQVSKLRE
jgi:O-antigen ligase